MALDVDRLFIGSMSEKQADIVVDLLNNYSSVANLTHSIYDIDAYAIEQKIDLIEAKEKAKGGITPDDIAFSLEQKSLGTLSEEQTMGVAFMYYAKSCLLGDATGKGKTVQVAGLTNIVKSEFQKANKPFRYLFVTEATSATQMRKKMMRFTGEYVGLFPTGTAPLVAKYIDSYALGGTYSVVGTHALLKSGGFLAHMKKHPFDMIIIDESDVMANSTSELHKNTKEVLSHCDRRILLNATPMGTSVMNFYWQLKLVDPKMLPNVGEFKKAFCVCNWSPMKRKEIVKYKNEAVFKEAISLRYLARVRKRKDVDLPNVVLVPLSDAQRALMKRTSLYQMVSDYPTGVDPNIPFTVETSPKIGCVLSLLRNNQITKEGRAMIYCKYLECQSALQDTLEEAGYVVLTLNGGVAVNKRGELIDKFNRLEYDILITNVLRGLDLFDCDNVIIYSLDGNPQKLVQAEGRIIRDEEAEGKSLYMLISQGKERKKYEDIMKKRMQSSTDMSVTESGLVSKALLGACKLWVYDADYETVDSVEEE